jgi:hypothetical protein
MKSTLGSSTPAIDLDNIPRTRGIQLCDNPVRNVSDVQKVRTIFRIFVDGTMRAKPNTTSRHI